MKKKKNLSVFPGFVMAGILLVSPPGILRAQEPQTSAPLTLSRAVTIALERNPERKAALADAKAASADVKEAHSFLFPHIGFSETATRGNDPVYVFGDKLRQQRFATSDFALNVLNTPVPFGNFATRFGGTWNLFNSFGSWHAINRAEREKDAVGHQLERTDQEIVFRVVASYYDVLLARKQMDVAEQAVKTAQAILDRSKDRVDSGVVVESDYLSAQVRMAERKQELIRGRNDLELARAQLNTAMGISPRTGLSLAEVLAEKSLPALSLDEIEKKALEARPDLKRVRSEEAAQQQSVSMAKSAFGPRVNAFADWEADNPTFLAGNGGSNWIAGIEVQVDLFQGEPSGLISLTRKLYKKRRLRWNKAPPIQFGWKCAELTTIWIRPANRLKSRERQLRQPRKACASHRTATTPVSQRSRTYLPQMKVRAAVRRTIGRPSTAITQATRTSSWQPEH